MEADRPDAVHTQTGAMPVIAAFDFDGTMTYRDTFLPFLRSCTSLGNFMVRFLCALPPLFLSWMTQKNARQACKECLLTKFFEHKSITELRQSAHTFAQSGLKDRMRPEAIRRLRWHQKQGHLCILVSAALGIYLVPWAKEVGFDAVIASELATDAEGKVTGKLKGLNCRGAEKTRRLQEAYGPKSRYTLYVYGDSAGDAELLALADYAYYRVFPGDQADVS